MWLVNCGHKQEGLIKGQQMLHFVSFFYFLLQDKYITRRISCRNYVPEVEKFTSFLGVAFQPFCWLLFLHFRRLLLLWAIIYSQVDLNEPNCLRNTSLQGLRFKEANNITITITITINSSIYILEKMYSSRLTFTRKHCSHKWMRC